MRKFSVLFIFIFFIFGCGKVYYVDKYPDNITKAITSANGKILILPFNNYVNMDYNYWVRLNYLIYNAIYDYFLTDSIIAEPFNEIVSLLKNENYINFKEDSESEIEISKTILEELNNSEWSNEMRKEILKIAYNSEKEKYKNKNFKFSPYLNISRMDIFDINNYFKSDYIIYGEIEDFSITEDNTYNPFKIGFINSPTKLMSKALFGVEENENWGRFQDVFSGVLIGGIIGSFTNEPFSKRTTRKEAEHLFGITVNESHSGTKDHAWKNAAFWGTVGGFSSYIGSHGGKLPRVNLGIKIYIYDALSKNLLWTNRIKLHATPCTSYSDRNINQLIEYAVSQSIFILLNDYNSYLHKFNVFSQK